MEEKFVIQGGKPLRGEVEIRGAKNAAFPILAASLLTKETCTIDNLPLIEDVLKMIKILEALGAKISWVNKRKIEINCAKIDSSKIPQDLVKCFRGSILLLGGLLGRFDKIEIPAPGGCVIGSRPIDTHLDAFEQAGVKIKKEKRLYKFTKSKIDKPREIILREVSVTATENMLLFAATSFKKKVIKIADEDYQVQDLMKVLEKMGVEIMRTNIRELEVVGRAKLKGFKHSIVNDPIEAGTFIVATLATKGEVTIKNAELEYLELFLKRLKDFGANFKIIDSKTIKILPSRNLRIDKIQSLPYPGIHSDLQPELGVLATQTKGPTLIHDPLFEGRLRYLNELNKMGADIIFCDPHRAIVYGPTQLQGAHTLSLDLRAGAAVIIAGLIAKGETVVNNIYQIDRGYEKIEQRLQELGADIKRRIKS
ncbi:MAG: UDP-N-acetylglucosamine 1-carboxyvinyltransferase [Nanoarchaeota archaeon]|nr:UDP-N-acetylglucosamine 1-carboxyvinyltransferase [Patescibacteria group bacterium]MBU4124641.1 UDP-N-acetylglucosamine 1-carboxyvinyltransferase [Nanoarchaeota archaeon]